ncbi:hypothetical protein [Roseateles sp. PN1]|uniref:hypothetical protein n=1 Tax=Roseateles sp. PN1 TaxID=3137372 RepID=UPI003138CDF7
MRIAIFRFVLAFSALLVGGGVAAQPYKCTVNGKVVYQDAKCDGGVNVNVSGAGAADFNSPSAQLVRRELEAAHREKVIGDAMRDGRVIVGMTAEEVVRVWGRPTKINQTITASVVSEQWVYRREKIGDDQYVYLSNGFVRTIQTTR